MAKDKIHETVKNALIKDGWKITHDPFPLTFARKTVFVDLGAEKLFGAEKDGEKIAVEIKSFIGQSPMRDLQTALGQYQVYHSYLKRSEPERHLFLAVSQFAYDGVFAHRNVQVIIEDYNLHLIVIDLEREEISQWVN